MIKIPDFHALPDFKKYILNYKMQFIYSKFQVEEPTHIYCRDLIDHLMQICKYPYTGTKETTPLFCAAGFIQNTKNEKGHYGRSQENHDGQYAIVLDYDSGFKIEDFYCPYRYLLYTSSSHSPELHKFRVIIDLEEIIPSDIWRKSEFKEAILMRFPGVDESSCATLRFFVLPNKGEHYTWYYNDAPKWDWKRDLKLNAKYKELKAENDKREAEFNIVENTATLDTYEKCKRYVDAVKSEENFNVRGTGKINAILMRLNMKMKGEGLSSHQRAQILSEDVYNTRTLKEIAAITKN